jgi:AcrR family transcriptional regulator
MAPHDRPGPHALLAAVRDFLIDHVAAEGDERLRFHARVAASVLGVAQRELLLGEAHQAAHRERLAGLGCADDAELSRRIREGGLDDRFDEVVAVVWAAVLDKLAVADPRHHTRPVSARAIDPGALDPPKPAGPTVSAAP